ncbi:MAG: hydantoinase/oxoprolinase family protein [Chloroflexi bacterium]|nr:hydantoinase/oxoprolinase family protein [Chloroflexota bacterium]
MTNQRLAIDVGGTFVDFVLFDEASGEICIEKVSSGGKLEERFFEGIERLGLSLTDLAMIVHGSTTVINTIVQEKGARTGLITTQGFRDVLELGRGNRPEIYNLFYRPPAPLVPRYLRYEVPERLNRRGETLIPLDEAAARQVIAQLKEQGVLGIAICFLHSYANPAHERRLAELVAEIYPEAHVSISSDIVREWREFERASTTVLNTYVKPKMAGYLSALQSGLKDRHYTGTLNIMQSSGGMTSGLAAQNAPIRTLESGPAGGVIGAAALGAKLGFANLVAADVGGTTFDVAMIHQNRPLEKAETAVNRRPVLQPTLDIISIGAGGGSIAWLDAEGGLRVGPKSAEAAPGPACFGLGGAEPTVTDAQLILGYLDPQYYLGKRMTLDRAAAERAIETKIAQPLNLPTTEAAQGILRLAAANMSYAIRNITIERGHDPREFSLVCFGGGGGLFAAALMRELEMARAIVPVNPATFSAWGLLNADYREDLSRTVVKPLKELRLEELAGVISQMEAEATEHFDSHHIQAANRAVELFADLRYLGQEHTVRVPLQADDLKDPLFASLRTRFDDLHEKAYAHALPHLSVEFVHVRLSLIGLTQKPAILEMPKGNKGGAQKAIRKVILMGNDIMDCPIYDRPLLAAGERLDGPAIVEEWTSTTLLLPGQTLEVDPYGNLILHASH